jgi:hypothetical protein
VQADELSQNCPGAEGGGASSSRVHPKRAPLGAAPAAVSPASELECDCAGQLSPQRAATAQHSPARQQSAASVQPHSSQLGARHPQSAPGQVRAAPASTADPHLPVGAGSVAPAKRSSHKKSGIADLFLSPKEREPHEKKNHEEHTCTRLPAPGGAAASASPSIPPVGRAASHAPAAPPVTSDTAGRDCSAPGNRLTAGCSRDVACSPNTSTAGPSQPTPSRPIGSSSPAQARPSSSKPALTPSNAPSPTKPTRSDKARTPSSAPSMPQPTRCDKALTSSSAPPAPKPTRCDKCDGAHESTRCPHYKRARDRHPDAQPGRKGIFGDASVPLLLRRGKIISQPGDGSCLFHSLRYGLARMAPAERRGAALPSTAALRQQLARWVVDNSNLCIADTPVHKWVRWDSGVAPQAYAARMARSGWGGGIEMAACSRLMGVNVWVYEKIGRGYERISCFDAPGGGGSGGGSGGGTNGGARGAAAAAGTVHILYRGGVHYDALLPEGDELAAAVARAAQRPVKTLSPRAGQGAPSSPKAGQGGPGRYLPPPQAPLGRGPPAHSHSPAGQRYSGGKGKAHQGNQGPGARSGGGWRNGRGGSRGVGKRVWVKGRGRGRGGW